MKFDRVDFLQAHQLIIFCKQKVHKLDHSSSHWTILAILSQKHFQVIELSYIQLQ